MEHLIICSNGAIPSNFTKSLNFFPDSDEEGKREEKQENTCLIEENIYLKKQLKALTNKLKRIEKERDAYKLYVPQELLSYADIVKSSLK